jgi:hypothetical protein
MFIKIITAYFHPVELSTTCDGFLAGRWRLPEIFPICPASRLYPASSFLSKRRVLFADTRDTLDALAYEQKGFDCKQIGFACEQTPFDCKQKGFACEQRRFAYKQMGFVCNQILLACKQTPFDRKQTVFDCKQTLIDRNQILLACKQRRFAYNEIVFACKKNGVKTRKCEVLR